MPNKFAMAVRDPIGVVGAITPWNFPIAIPSWKLMPALIAGNTVVFKPAEDTPLLAIEFVKMLEEAGLPEGVVNVVLGPGGSVGEAIIEHPDVELISFTGSTAAGQQVAMRGRADPQARIAGDGRQERHHRHGRRRTWTSPRKAFSGAPSARRASAAPPPAA